MWIAYISCGIVGVILVVGVFAFVKSRGANSNYTEFSIDDVPTESLWRWDDK